MLCIFSSYNEGLAHQFTFAVMTLMTLILLSINSPGWHPVLHRCIGYQSNVIIGSSLIYMLLYFFFLVRLVSFFTLLASAHFQWRFYQVDFRKKTYNR